MFQVIFLPFSKTIVSSRKSNLHINSYSLWFIIAWHQQYNIINQVIFFGLSRPLEVYYDRPGSLYNSEAQRRGLNRQT